MSIHLQFGIFTFDIVSKYDKSQTVNGLHVKLIVDKKKEERNQRPLIADQLAFNNNEIYL